MAYQASSSSATASSSRLRHRFEAEDDAVRNGAYLARPPVSIRTRLKGKQRESLRSKIIPGLDIGSKGWVREGFRIFGEHCARNQIRTLLIDCLVMTNLFYPALSIYLTKRSLSHTASASAVSGNPAQMRSRSRLRTISTSSTPLLDTFFPSPPPIIPELDWNGWWDDPGQGTSNDWSLGPASRLSDESSVRIVRIGWTNVEKILERNETKGRETWTERDFEILNLVRQTAEGWEEAHSELGQGCVRRLRIHGHQVEAEGDCYLLSSEDIEGTVPLSTLRSAGDGMDTASEELDGPHVGLYRSIGAVFCVKRKAEAIFDQKWADAVARIGKLMDAEVFVDGGARSAVVEEWSLAFTPESGNALPGNRAVKRDIDEWPPKSVLFLYIVLFSVLGHELSNATKVHSQFGLAFTGCVQLCCSAVMSFSVLALLGWNGWGWNTGVERSLPTYILPFVIVVVGAENMSTLTKAVFSVPFTHSVPVRIGLGLSKVGTTIAITSFTDVALLLLIWLFVNVRPVREFCLFAAVVIITDWFMLHTFFLTILSIDAQRLELADVLASNGQPEPAPRLTQVEKSTTRSGWRKVLRARTSKSGSLLFILATIAFIYYLTERHMPTLGATNFYGLRLPSPTASPFITTIADLAALSDGESLWRALNPAGLSTIRMTLAAPFVLVLPKDGHPVQPADLRRLTLRASRMVIPRLKPVLHLLKVLILPQAITAGALYALLLYLLKDADLLDAQRNKLGRNEEHRPTDEDDHNAKALHGVKVNILPCTHESDIDLITASSDGRTLVTAGVDNTLCLWRFDGSSMKGTREILKSEHLSKEDVITDMTISADGKSVAALALNGSVHIWDVPDDGTPTAQDVVRFSSGTPIRIRYNTTTRRSEDPFVVRPSSPNSITLLSLLVAFEDGAVMLLDEAGERMIIPPQSPNSKCRFITSNASGKSELFILITDNEGVMLYRQDSNAWPGIRIPKAAAGWVTSASVSQGNLAVGYSSGIVEVFDLNGTPILGISGATSSVSQQDRSRSLTRLTIASPAVTKCITCGLQSSESMFVISSTSDRVYVHRVSSRGVIACRCNRRSSALDDLAFNNTQQASSPARLIPPSTSRNGFSPASSPKRSPSLLPPVSNPEFPVSSHGTRRLSALHRDDASPSVGIGFTGMSTTTPSSPESDLEAVPLGAIPVPWGGSTWSVIGDRVIGTRRVQGGIDDSQWEVWSLDLSAPWNGNQLVLDCAPITSLLVRAPQVGENSVRAQRAERLLSLSGRAPFPSLGASFSVETFAPLAYTEIRPFHPVDGVCDEGNGRTSGRIIIGLGNRAGVITIPLPKAVRRMTSGQSGLGLGIGGMVTPPPPFLRKDNVDMGKKTL